MNAPAAAGETRAVSPRLSVGAWILIAALAALYLFLYGWQPATTPAVGGGDFAVYLTSGRMLLNGRSPYTTPGWNYPPLISFLIAPLAALPARTAWWCWFLLCHCCVAWAAWWTWRALGGGLRALWPVAFTWTAGHAIAVSLIEGQVNPLLLVLLCLAFWPPARAPWLGSLAVGAAFALKVWPGILWAEDLLRRRWRRLLVGGATAAALIAAPLFVLACWFDGPLRPQRAGNYFSTPAFLNASLPGLVLRLRDPLCAGQRLPHNWLAGGVVEQLRLSDADRLLAAVVSLTALLGGLALIWLVRRPRPETAAAWQPLAALIALALVAAPVSWPHYPVLQLPGTAALAGRFVGRRQWARLAGLAAAFLAVNWTEALVEGPYVAAYGIEVVSPAITWAVTTLPVAGGVALFALHLAELRATARNEAHDERLPTVSRAAL